MAAGLDGMARVPLGKSTGVDLGSIAGLQHSNCGWRRDKPGVILRSHGGAVASQRPRMRLALKDQVWRVVLKDHGTIGQLGCRHRQVVQQLPAALYTLRMQHPVDVTGSGHYGASARWKSRLECPSRCAPAEKARAMSGGKASCFIQKEQFRPTASAHDVAADVAPLEGANQPRPAGPATCQKRAGLRIVNDAPIACKGAALGDRDDIAHGRDAILERHGFNAARGRSDARQQARAFKAPA